jgi:hypothetical protein
MRIRMKISYYAWKSMITVKELILNKILETYIYFSTNKFKPLNIDTMLGDGFNPKNILNNYISQQSKGKQIKYETDKRKQFAKRRNTDTDFEFKKKLF